MKSIREVILKEAFYDEMYDPEDSFIGKIIIDEDEKFEGIVQNYNHTSRHFVFGLIKDDKMRLYRCTKSDKELPKVYRGNKESLYRFEGEVSATTAFAECPLGECRMTVMDPNLYYDIDEDQEIQQVGELVDDFKKSLGKDTEALYNDVFWKETPKTYKKNTQN